MTRPSAASVTASFPSQGRHFHRPRSSNPSTVSPLGAHHLSGMNGTKSTTPSIQQATPSIQRDSWELKGCFVPPAHMIPILARAVITPAQKGQSGRISENVHCRAQGPLPGVLISETSGGQESALKPIPNIIPPQGQNSVRISE